MHNKRYLIVVGGPTASGKTAFAIRLAKHFNTHILSCDSRQFYREMNIGTAKPTKTELKQAPHHFVDHLSIHQAYSVGDFERDAQALLDLLFEQHPVVILSGGAGLFIKAVCEGLDEFPDVPQAIQEQLQSDYEQKGLVFLQEELARTDPDYHQQVDLQNPHRLLRALSVIRATGLPFSSFRRQESTPRSFRSIYLQMDWPREVLYERINRRVDQMLEAGLEEEARQLFPLSHLNALQTVGYQELFDHFKGGISLEEAVELIKRNSRRYAKRQLTWLRRDGFWRLFSPSQFEQAIDYISEILQNSEA
ncbi:MAG: tRNA (adenosine(37)-N6)-dimethylallyltransferase MiaA [Saprospiraceae bacterium]